MKVNSGFTQFFILLKLSLKNNFSLSYFKVNKKRLWEPIVIALALIPVACLLIYGYIALLSASFDQLSALGQSHSILTLAIAISSVFVLVFGIFWIISSFYFSNDLEKLMPLPVSSTSLLMSKLATVVINEYLTLLITLLPAIIVYGVKASAGVGYYLMSLLVFLLLPIIPLAIASLVALVVMRFVNLKKLRTLLIFASVIVFIGIYFWFQYTATSLPLDTDANVLMQMLFVAQDGIVKMISRIFPPSLWATLSATLAFTWTGIINFVKYLGTTAIMTLLVALTGKKLFYLGLQGGQQVQSKSNKAIFYNKGDAILSPEVDPKKAIARRDFKVFFRNTVFVLNGLIGAVLLPGLVLIYTVGPMKELQEMQELTVYLTDPTYGPYKVLIASLFIIFIAISSLVGAASFSREGMDFSVSKTIPVSPQDQIKGKLRFCNLLCMLMSVPTLVLCQYIMKLSIVELLMTIVLSAIAILSANIIGLLFDLRKPLLKWDNPQRAVKNNLNSMVFLLFFMLIVVVIGFVDIKLMTLGMSSNLLYIVTLAIFAIITVIFYSIIMKLADNLYKRIEL